jgi:purine-binding chemotaxis protein CheW
VHHLSGQYLTFRVGRQDFAIDASRVRGLLPAHDITPVEIPDSYACGFASMLGHEFPVIDLRRKLSIGPGSRGRAPCIIVIEGLRLVALIADRVSDVVTLRESDIRNDVVRVSGRSRRVLDANEIVTETEMLGLLRPALIP